MGSDGRGGYREQGAGWAYSGVPGRRAGELTIDPGIIWSTYISGDDGYADIADMDYDGGYLYMVGKTDATRGLASPAGVYQPAKDMGFDAYLSKFDTNGRHIWTTYYGSYWNEGFTGVRLGTGGIYALMVGTSTRSGLTGGGTEQDSMGNVLGTVSYFDGLLAKFSKDGKRVWARYIGGNRSDVVWGMALDAKDNIYLTGLTNSTTGIATAGAFKAAYTPSPSGDTVRSESYDAFLMKLDSAGKKKWGTYIGGNSEDRGYAVTAAYGYVYVAGSTRSLSGFATAGVHQTWNDAAATDAYSGFLLRFDTLGTRKWGTYYGGKEGTVPYSVVCNKLGHAVLGGVTFSTTNIAHPGAYQPVNAGKQDAFLAKFDTAGVRLWGTYLGGTELDLVYGPMYAEEKGDDINIHFSGATASHDMATADAFLDTIPATAPPRVFNHIGFIASVSGSGMPYFYTYFGGESGHDGISSCRFINGHMYFAGSTRSGTGISTTGAYKEHHNEPGVVNAGFLTKAAKGKPVSLATANQSKGSMVLFPNPCREQLQVNVQFTNAIAGNATVSVFNILGKQVYQQEVPIHQGALNANILLYESLQAGVYTLRVSYQDWSSQQSFVKQ
jgi:hypothetical protein